MQDEILASLSASAPRRSIGIAMLMLLGGALIYVAITQPADGIGWRVLVAAAGLGVLMLGERIRRSTVVTLELTREVLRDSAGVVLARIEQIQGVERGIFAFKPSNGFVLTTREAGDRCWKPGLYWRMGRRVGVGGMTQAGPTKLMAEMIQMLLSERAAAQG